MRSESLRATSPTTPRQGFLPHHRRRPVGECQGEVDCGFGVAKGAEGFAVSVSSNKIMPDDNFIIPPDTDAGIVARMTLQERVDRAIKLLKEHEPAEGYCLAYSGGKDSDTCKKLLQLSGVKFESWYNQTTIDPPELVRHVKSQSDVKWSLANKNMMSRVAEKSAAPPTRMMRWCCDEYKENSQPFVGRVKIVGVRAAESPRRKHRWSENALDMNKQKTICPIVYWSDDQVWEFLKQYGVTVCVLYSEGWKRLGCVGCPLNNQSREKEFVRWPAFERNWKNAVVKNWENFHDKQTLKGKPTFQSRFKSGEELWHWWMQDDKAPDPFREDCQSGLMWTNDDGLQNSPS